MSRIQTYRDDQVSGKFFGDVLFSGSAEFCKFGLGQSKIAKFGAINERKNLIEIFT